MVNGKYSMVLLSVTASTSAEQIHEFGALRTDCTHGMWRQKEASSGISLEDERLILSFCQKFIGSQNGD